MRARRTFFSALEVNPNENLSDLKGKSGSYPQMVQTPSSTTAWASLRETILGVFLAALGMSGVALATKTIGETTSKA